LDTAVIKSTLSKWLQDAARNTGKPNLVLAMISMLLAATIIFFQRGIFWLAAGRLQTSRSGWVLLWTVIFVSGNRHLEKIPQPSEFNDLLD
jgi:hypothetical protein